MSPSPANRPDDEPRPPRRRHGEHFWHAAADPVFLLNRERRLLYANPAWEQLTGLSFADARGRGCRRRGVAAEPLEQVLAALAPPPEALRGQTCQIRRRAPGKTLAWWIIDFFPWSDAQGPPTILAKIQVLRETGSTHAVLPEKLVQLRDRHNQAYRLEAWQSDAPAMQRLVVQIRLAAATTAPVMLQGPPGSGKTWAARTIHRLGKHAEGFFATFDTRLPAAGVAELLASSRACRVGTIYVHHVERLERDAQALLAERLAGDTLEQGPRLLASSSANLPGEVRAGRLLPELHARLGILTLDVPPLADRLADLPALVHDLLPRAAAAADKGTRGLSPEALDRLRQHAWPGNVRELYDVLFQACQRTRSEEIDVGDLPFYLRGAAAPAEHAIPLDETLAKVERRLIELALQIAQGNKSAAAQQLAIWRPRLTRRMEMLGMEPGERDDGKPAPESGPASGDQSAEGS